MCLKYGRFIIIFRSFTGYGDIELRAPRDRLFTAAYMLIGIGFVGSALGVAVSQFLDREEAAIQQALKRKDEANRSRSLSELESGHFASQDFTTRQKSRWRNASFSSLMVNDPHYQRLVGNLIMSAVNVLGVVTVGTVFFALVERQSWWVSVGMVQT